MKTMKKVSCLFLGVLFTGFVAAEPTVKVAGVMVVAEHYVAPQEKSEFMRSLSVFNSSSVGTKLALMVEYTEGTILEVEDDLNKLTKWGDDTGAEFSEGKEKKSGNRIRHGLSSFGRISKDHKVALVEIGGEHLPAKGATQLIAQGEIGLKVAGVMVVAEHYVAPQSLKKGATFEVGEGKYTVKEVKKAGSELRVTLSCNTDPHQYAGFAFKDASGKVVKARKSGHSMMNLGLVKKTTVSIRIEEPIEEGVIEISVWKDLKTLTVPFDLKVGIAGR